MCLWLTQVTDVLSELFKCGAQAFGVSCDFWGVHHKGNTVDFVFKARPLHIAHSVWGGDWLVWAKLEERKYFKLLKKKKY